MVLAGLIFLSKSTPNLTNLEAIDLVTSDHNFDIVRWEFMAIWKKAQARSLNLPDYLPTEKQVQLIKAYYSSPELATQAGLDPDSYALVLKFNSSKPIIPAPILRHRQGLIQILTR